MRTIIHHSLNHLYCCGNHCIQFIELGKNVLHDMYILQVKLESNFNKNLWMSISRSVYLFIMPLRLVCHYYYYIHNLYNLLKSQIIELGIILLKDLTTFWMLLMIHNNITDLWITFPPNFEPIGFSVLYPNKNTFEISELRFLVPLACLRRIRNMNKA